MTTPQMERARGLFLPPFLFHQLIQHRPVTQHIRTIPWIIENRCIVIVIVFYQSRRYTSRAGYASVTLNDKITVFVQFHKLLDSLRVCFVHAVFTAFNVVEDQAQNTFYAIVGARPYIVAVCRPRSQDGDYT